MLINKRDMEYYTNIKKPMDCEMTDKPVKTLYVLVFKRVIFVEQQ